MPFLKHPCRLMAAAFVFAAALAFLPSLLRPAPRYTVTDLSALPGYAVSNAVSINSQGTAAGYAITPGSFIRQQAAMFQSGKIVSLNSAKSAGNSIARSVNSFGEVTGWVEISEVNHAFTYSRGKMHILGAPHGFNDSRGVAINDNGEVVVLAKSDYTPQSSGVEHAFLYRQGKMTDIGALPGYTNTQACSINSAGQVVGICSRAGTGPAAIFLYDSRHRMMSALPMPVPYRNGGATHINDKGQVVGFVVSGSPCHAALWSSGHFTDLGVLPGDDGSGAGGLNNQGVIVGQSGRDDNNPLRKFLRKHTGSGSFWQHYRPRAGVISRAFVCRNGRMQDLNTLIPADADWALEDAESVNDQGQIVGYGLHHGKERAFLLTPVR